MRSMNQDDVKDMHDALRNRDDVPNLRAGAKTLHRLMGWTNSHSDGWMYWRKPGNASARLQEVLHDRVPFNVHGVPLDNGEDITEAELKRLLSPIKAFLTKQGADHDEVIWLPERDSRRRTRAVVTIRLDLPVDLERIAAEPGGEEYAKYKTALASLADVMAVQAEDGLYLHGHEEAEGGEIDGVEVANEYVSDISRFTYDVHLERYEVTREEARSA